MKMERSKKNEMNLTGRVFDLSCETIDVWPRPRFTCKAFNNPHYAIQLTPSNKRTNEPTNKRTQEWNRCATIIHFSLVFPPSPKAYTKTKGRF